MKIVFFTLILLFSSISLGGETYALLIGVNKYEASDAIVNLEGAVNDANAIYDSLLYIGTPKENIVKLLDEEATKDSVKNHWRRLISRSNAGDTLIFTFAGHGMQENDRNEDEANRDPDDKLDETLLLSGFAELPKTAHKERLIDDELHRLFSEADGRQVIYIADSCHSGDSFRSIDLQFKPDQWQARYVPKFNNLTYAETPDSGEETSNIDEMNLENFYFFAATESNKKVYEGTIEVDGVPTRHGALSWVFSQALRDATLFVDGKLTLTELAQYIMAEVKNQTSNGQFTNITPRSGKEILFSMAGEKPEKKKIQASSEVVKVEIRGNFPKWLDKLDTIKITETNPDYIWNTETGSIYNKRGDLITKSIHSRKHLQKVADRWQLIQTVNELGKGHYIDTQLSAKNTKKDINAHAKLHAIGEEIEFYLSGLKHRQLMQFNITGNGDIQCNTTISATGEYDDKFLAVDPAGNDNLVTLAIDNPSKELKILLDRSNKCPKAIEVAQALPELLEGKQYQIGRVDIFTGEEK